MALGMLWKHCWRQSCWHWLQSPWLSLVRWLPSWPQQDGSLLEVSLSEVSALEVSLLECIGLVGVGIGLGLGLGVIPPGRKTIKQRKS